jgi:prepilin-type N-terminal cleavage/methylation domain-containing protein
MTANTAPAHTRRRHAATRGFSLLEVIVALAMLAGISATMFAWTTSLVAQDEQFNRIVEEENIRSEVLTTLRAVNIASAPERTGTLNGCLWRWQSEAIAPARRANAFPKGMGDFEITPYRVSVSVQRRDAQLCRAEGLTFALQTYGWRRLSPYRETP